MEQYLLLPGKQKNDRKLDIRKINLIIEFIQ
jgi:hypothetical protein